MVAKTSTTKKKPNVHTRSGWLREAWPAHIRLTTLAANHCAAFARAHNGERDKIKKNISGGPVSLVLSFNLRCGTETKIRLISDGLAQHSVTVTAASVGLCESYHTGDRVNR